VFGGHGCEFRVLHQTTVARRFKEHVTRAWLVFFARPEDDERRVLQPFQDDSLLS
jgi:hypothetical protein